MKEWSSFKELFEVLNTECNCLVLRNYTDISDEGKKDGVHEDIDFLCEDQARFIEVVGCEPRKSAKDKIHQKISVGGAVIPIDIRYVGDGYYDPAWEADMLKNKRLYNELFYIPDEKDEFYSLIYHAVIQKNTISKDYAVKLAAIAGIPEFTEEWGLKELESFMREKGYRYTYPVYPGGIFRKDKASKDLAESNAPRALKRLLWKLHIRML